MNTDKRHISVSHSFFEKAKLDYSDWIWAWVREVIQNSYDAEADTIIIGAKVNDQNDLIVSVDDNGSGMDEDTLINVLMCLGGTKKSADSVGGFGVAKSLLFLAHKSYRIETHNILLEGSGGDYEITKFPKDLISGTRIVVNMGVVLELRTFLSTVEDYVSQMFPERDLSIILAPCPNIKGYEKPIRLSMDSVSYDEDVETDLGTLYYNEISGKSTSQDTTRSLTEGTSTLMVANRGLPMFPIRVDHGGRGTEIRSVINISGDYTWFTSNRDGLVYNKRCLLQKLIFNLSNQRSALTLGKKITLVINSTKYGEGTHHTYTALPTADQLDLIDSATVESKEKDHKKLIDKIIAGFELSRHYHPDFVLQFEGAVNRGGSMSVSSICQVLNKKKSLKLAKLWNEHVKELLGLPMFKNMPAISTGFLFTERDIIARCIDDQYILLNINHCMKKDFDTDDLWDIAIHECTHLLVSSHNEEFCSMEFNIRHTYRHS